MTTIWPAYEGSDKTSWYPDMQVLMTTSPLACVARPPRSPTSTNPSSSRRTIGSGMLHHPFHHDLAVAQGHHDASAEPPPGKGRVFSPTLEGGAVHGPLHKGVDQDPLVVDCLSDDLARSLDTGSVEHPIVEPQPHHDRHGGLEAMEPVRAGGLGAHVVRSMVGGDRIDHAFGQRRERATQDDLAHQMAPVVGEGDRAGPL